MENLSICYEGPFYDYSGYGEANRQILTALDAVDISINGKLLRYTRGDTDYGYTGSVVKKALSNNCDYDIKIMHVTPDEIPRLIELEKYSISHFFWETSKVPDVFVDGLNLVNEIWTGSQANVEAIRNSGVDTPVYVFPQPMNLSFSSYEPFDVDHDGFLFYSIFEWTDRKNPEALIRAYNKAFRNNENVGLVLKTYINDFSNNSKQKILDKIKNAQLECDIKNKIFFHHELMTTEQMHGIHKRCDCYVSSHRGEGWGVPQAEAMSHSNPIISTGYGGINEYITNMYDGIVIPYTLVPLKGMDHARHYYSEDQMWAEIDEDILAEKMLMVYQNQAFSRKMGKNARKTAGSIFSYKAVGTLMRNRLEQISKEI